MPRSLILLLLVLVISHAVVAKYEDVDRIIVIMNENWSFDALLGKLEGVNGNLYKSFLC